LESWGVSEQFNCPSVLSSGHRNVRRAPSNIASLDAAALMRSPLVRRASLERRISEIRIIVANNAEDIPEHASITVVDVKQCRRALR